MTGLPREVACGLAVLITVALMVLYRRARGRL
jgi:hypothetical protein